jgi:hypothetical protein
MEFALSLKALVSQSLSRLVNPARATTPIDNHFNPAG